MEGKVPISVIILTYNEEANIEYALKSVHGWADEIFIVDSYSTDRTIEIAERYTHGIYQREFVHWADQRNWAVGNLPLSNDWILFLDADEQVTDCLRTEVADLFSSGSIGQFDALAVRQKFIFLGKWLKYSHEAKPLIRLVRKGKVKWIARGDVEPCEVSGVVGKLEGFLLHCDHRGLSYWIEKHNKNASREVGYLTQSNERQESIVRRLYYKMPLFLRPFVYFLHRYLLKGGFLDGLPGFIYCFLHACWYRFLVDAKYYEMKVSHETTSSKLQNR